MRLFSKLHKIIIAVFRKSTFLNKLQAPFKAPVFLSVAAACFFLTTVFSLSIITTGLYTRENNPLQPKASAATNNTINFQARLLTNTGALVPDGNYHIEFKLYDSLAAGASAQGVCSTNSSTDDCWWKETRTTGNLVAVKNGYISVSLGSVTPFGANIPWDQELWLTMNIGGNNVGASWNGEMSPRMKITSLPFSQASAKLKGTNGLYDADQLVQLGPGSVQTISSTGAAVRINQTGTGALLQIQGAGSDKLTLAANGDLSVAGTGIFQGSSVSIGTTAQAGVLTLSDGSSNTTTIQAASTSANLSFTLPSAYGSSGDCIVGNGAGGLSFSNTCGAGGSGSAPTTASYLTLSNDTTLTAERVLTAGSNISVTDGGANSTLTIGVVASPVFSGTLTVQGASLTIGTNTQAGSLVLNDGSNNTTTLQSAAIAGNLSFTLPSGYGSSGNCLVGDGAGGLSFSNTCGSGGSGTAPAGASYLTLGLDGTLTNERVLTAGSNITITDGGANGNLSVGLTNSSLTVTAGTGLSGGGSVALGSITTLNLANTTVTANSYGSASSVATFTVDGQGRLTAAASTPIAINGNQISSGSVAVANGGTGATTAQGAINTLAGLTTNGDLLYYDGTNATRLARGTNGQCLTSNGTTLVWGDCNASGSGNYIQNSTANQNSANFNMQSAATTSVTAKFRAIAAQTADIIQIRDSSDTTTVFSVAPNGNLTAGTLNGATISGGTLSATAVNGVTTANIVLTSGSYADPTWITSLAKSKVGLANVENTALSTWAGSSNITTLGTINSGVWNGTAIAVASGGTGATTASGARTNLGATTVGGNLFTLTNPSAVTFIRINADNSVSTLDAASFRTAIGAGTSSTTGTVTSVSGSGGTTGLTLSGGPITTSGTLTLGGTLAVGSGGTGLTTATSNGVLYGNGTGVLQVTAASTGAYQCLITVTAGSAPVWGNCNGAGSGFTNINLAGNTGTTQTINETDTINVRGDGAVLTSAASATDTVTLSVVADSIGNAQLAFDTGQNLTTTSNVQFANITGTGNLSVQGSITIGDAAADRLTINSQILGGTPLVFQGATDNGFTTSFAFNDPTVNQTITFPNATGTVCLTSGNCAGVGGTGDILQGGNSFTANMTIGTNDAYGLNLETAGVTRLSIDNSGSASLTGSLAVSSNFTVNTDKFTVDASTGAINIGASNNTGTITLGRSNSANNTINIGNVVGNTYTQTINIGSSSTGTTNITVGSATAGTTIVQGATRLSALTTNGFVKTVSGNGTLSVSSTVALGSEVSGTLGIGNGGTGATTAANARLNLATSQASTGTNCSTVCLNSIISADTRAVNDTPQQRDAGLFVDFKQNTTNGLSDGGTYNGVLNFRPYGTAGDFSGGQTSQLAVTDNGNLWMRTSTNATTWGTWYQMCSTKAVCSGYAPASGSGSYIQNQNAGQQATSNFWISGSGRADTSFVTPLIAGTSTGSLTVNAAGANTLLLQTNATTRFTVDSAASTLTGNGGTSLLGGTSLNLGSTGANTVTLATNGTNRFTVANNASTLTGNGATSLVGGTTLSLNSTGANAITMDTGGAAGITIGGNNANAVSIGNNNSSVAILSNGALNIGTNAVNKTVQIGAVGTTANTTTINMATSTGAAQTVNIGSTNTASTTNIYGGTNNINLLTNSASASVIVKSQTNGTNAFQVQNSSGTKLLGVDSSAQVVSMPNLLSVNANGGSGLYVDSVASGTTFNQAGSTFTVTASPSSASTGSYAAIATWATTTGANLTNALLYGVNGQAANEGTGTVGYVYGAQLRAFNQTTGTITNAAGLSAQVRNASTGTITNAYGISVASPANSGTITNNYGIYVENFTTGTNRYPLYLQGATNPILSINSNGDTSFRNQTNSTTAFNIQNAAGDSLFKVDTTNGRVFIGDDPGLTGAKARLYFGDIGGSASNVWVGEQSTTDTDILQLQGKNGISLTVSGAPTDVVTVGGDGSAIFRNVTNSTTAFRVQNTNGVNILNVDTANGDLEVGNYNGGTNPVNGKLVVNNSSNANTVTLQSGATSSSYTLTLPTTVGATNDCLKNSATAGTLTFGACAANLTLQTSYDTDTDGGDTIVSLTAADDSLIFRNPAVSGTDSNQVLTIDQLNTGNKDALVVNNAGTGNILTLQDSSTTVLKVVDGGSITAQGAATGTTGTTTAVAQTNTTTINLTAAGSFANNDVIFINNAGQDYYTRIVSGGGTTTLTVSPAVSYDASVTITKYNVQNIGATTTDYSTLNNRFFQGYFLGGIVTGAGSTVYSDGTISASPGLTVKNPTNQTNAFQVQNAAGTGVMLNADTQNGLVDFGGAGYTARVSINGGGIGFNRNISTGAIYDNTRNGYQFSNVVADGNGPNRLQLELYTTGGAANGQPLVVTGTGNVGIGTQNPGYKLTVNYTAPASFTNAVGDFNQMWQAGGTNILGVAASTGDTTTRLVTNNGYNLAFHANGATNPHMIILTNGNVGIGVSNPDKKFYVANSTSHTSGNGLLTGQFSTTWSSASNAGIYQTGLLSVMSLAPGAGTKVSEIDNGINAIDAQIIVQSTGNIGKINLIRAGGSPSYGTGVVDALRSLYVEGPRDYSGGTRTYTDAYGVYIGKMKQAVVTNGWGIYQIDATDKNYFGGNVGIGTTAPTATLTVGPNPVAVFNSNELFQIAKTGDAYMTISDGTGRLLMGTTSGTPFIGTQNATNLTFRTNNTVRLTVDTSGDAILTGKYQLSGASSYFGPGRSTDTSLVSNKAGSWTRIGSAGGLALWGGAGAETNDAPHLLINTSGNVSLSGEISGPRFVSGYGCGDVNAFCASNWFRSSGVSGWHNATYLTGIYSDETNVVRTYQNNVLRVYGSGNFMQLWTNTGTNAAYIGVNNSTSALALNPGAQWATIGDPGQRMSLSLFTQTSNCTIHGSLSCTSDIRLKNIDSIATGNLAKIMQLQPTYYRYKSDPNIQKLGLIAQNVQTVLPEFVSVDSQGYFLLDTAGLVTPLIGAVQEQQAMITDAQARLTALENTLQPSSNNILDLTNGGTIQGNLNVIGNLNVTGPVTMKSLTVTDDVVIAGNLTVENITVANLTINGHIITAGNTPTTTIGTAAGSADQQNNIPAPQVNIQGNDTSGTITIVAGANTAAGTLVEVNFDKQFTKTPKVVLTAGNEKTSELRFFRSAETGKFLINLKDAPQANQTYQFDYFVTE